MSWGTSFDANIYIARKHFQTKQDVRNHKEEIDKALKNLESIIFGYICANPNDVVSKDDKDYNSIIETLKYKFDGLMEEYNYNLITSYELDLLEENFDTKAED